MSITRQLLSPLALLLLFTFCSPEIYGQTDREMEQLLVEAKREENRIASMTSKHKKQLEEKYEHYLEQINTLYEVEEAKATDIVKKTLPIARERYGRFNDNFTNLQAMLGQLLQRQGAYEEAEVVMNRRKKNLEDQENIDARRSSTRELFTDDKGNPSGNGIFNMFQDLANATTQLEEANRQMEEDPAIRNVMRATFSYMEKALEDEHLDEGMEFKHIIPEVLGKKEEAVTAFKDKIAADGLNILRELPYLAEETQRQWITMYFNDLEIYQSYLHRNGAGDQALVEAVLNHQFKIKGFLTASKTALLAEIRSMDQATQELYRAWQVKNSWINQQLTMDASQQSRKLEEERKHAQQLENELAKKSKAFSTSRKDYQIKDIQAELAKGEAYIEFAHFDYWNTFQWTDSILYAAYIIKPKSIHFVPLFEEKELAISPIIERNVASNYVNRGGIKVGRKNTYGVLEKTLLAKLSPLLDATNTVYFSPSGKMHQFNLTALPTLSKKFNLRQFITHRGLFDDPTQKTNLERALVIGGIDYNEYIRSKDESFTVSGSTDVPWQPLPGTKKEAITIKELLSKSGIRTALSIGRSASEASLRSLFTNGIPPNILHISTHGYFYPALKKGVQGTNRFEKSTDPLIRSGLIFAGANGNWEKRKAHPDSDGIITAKEITLFDLNSTELVVLSACETGLGQVDESEGVYGLQRAFKIAGVKYIIMSLWEVPDEATKELM
ncbi:MAG: CHAT domain-containing protein, partial [Bacteroidota bacterium]